MGFFKICTSAVVRTLQGLDAHIRRRLRAIVLRHWKRRRTMVKRLIKLKVRPRTAWRSIYKDHRSWWALSHCAAVHRGLRNAYFADRGFIFLRNQWEEHTHRAVRAAPEKFLLPPG